jgi:hypothetical protein
MSQRDEVPGWLWRASLALLAASVLATLGLLAATLAGVADPRPVGALVVDDTFQATSGWKLTPEGSINTSILPGEVGSYRVTVRAGEGRAFALAPYDIEAPATIELSARQIEGQGDAGYGLWWANQGQVADLRLGVNSDGYLAILPGANGSGFPAQNWHLFPHVRSLGQINRFRIDLDRGTITIRLNDELVSQFASSWPGSISAGLFVLASEHGDATLEFLRFEVWQDHQGNP